MHLDGARARHHVGSLARLLEVLEGDGRKGRAYVP